MRRTPLRRKYTHRCEACDVTYHPEGRDQRYCSRECSAIGHTLPPLTCERCGRERSRRHGGRRFCGRACAAAANVKPRPTCPICNERPATLGQKTCSAACGYEHRKQAVRPRPCAGCGEAFRPYPSALGRGRKFCSLACYRATTALRPAMLTVACLNCGASFERTAAAIKRVKRSFCGSKCAHAFLQGENSGQWRGGSDPNRGIGWQKIAAAARDRDRHVCRRCGKSEAENGQRLSVDHIVPWRAFKSAAEANQLDNLASLCRPCHSRKSRAESKWLRGDVLEMWSYQTAITEAIA